MEEISVKRENAVAAYNVANDETKKVLVALLGEDFCKPQDIRDRVKTFGDACRELGDDHPLVLQYKLYDEQMKGNFDKMEDLTSFLKLRIITLALNEGWDAQFIPGEYRYYPFFNIYSKEEYDRLTDSERDEVGLVLWGGSANFGPYAGLAYAYSRHAFSNSSSHYGARLAFKSEELADYAGKQFLEIYADFCFKPNNHAE